MPTVQLFYVSRASKPYDDESVRNILETSRRNNPRDDITGCLLFSGRYYAQVLEGRAEVTGRKLETIRSDLRHVDFKLLVERRVDMRTYDQWSMGYLHDLDLEDRLEALLGDVSVSANAIVDVMERMQPDPVMGALR